MRNGNGKALKAFNGEGSHCGGRKINIKYALFPIAYYDTQNRFLLFALRSFSFPPSPDSQFSFFDGCIYFLCVSPPVLEALTSPLVWAGAEKKHSDETAIKCNIAKDNNNKSETASWWRSNSNLTKGNTTIHIYGGRVFIPLKIESGGGSKGTSGSFQNVFSSFLFSPISASQYFMDPSPLPMLFFLSSDAIWYLKLLSLLVMFLNILFGSSALDGA